MKPIAAGIALPFIAGMIAGSVVRPAAAGSATDSATVDVAVQVLPVAFIEFPDGFDFIITVPDWDDDHHHDGGHDDDHHGGGHDDGHGDGHHGGNGDDHHGGGHDGQGHDDGHGGGNKHEGGKGNNGGDHRADSRDKGSGDKGHDDKGYDSRDKGRDGGNKHDERVDNRHDERDRRGDGGRQGKHEVDNSHEDWQPIAPVLIPFKVRGNALASISVTPDDFMRVHGGFYLGEARREPGDSHRHQNGNGHFNHNGNGYGHGESTGDTLGYNVIVKFPIASWLYAALDGWDGFGPWRQGWASLPGTNGDGTPPLTADLSQRRHGALGMIFVLAKRYWTEDGKHARPGRYRGALQVTLTADEH
jgi:hypothetical protein